MTLKGSWDVGRDPLSALREGDPAPFEAFVSRETATFRGFFRRLGALPHEAEDLVQEVFLKLFRHADTYEPSGRFAAFAFRIARNAWIDAERRQAVRPRRVRGMEELGVDADALARLTAQTSAPGERASELEEGARIRSAVASLSERHRIVFELAVMQELPYHEISALLEIPEGTVKSRMFHAVRKLRELLEEPRALGRVASEGGRS